MSSAVLLAFTPDANMRAVGEAADAAGLALMLCGPGEVPSRGSLPSDRPLALLAVGPEGGAALAAWVAKHGLGGVAGVGLVGVTAPWAERRMCPACRSRPLDVRTAADSPVNRAIARGETYHTCGLCRGLCVQIGPLEPLRGMAERARSYCRCDGSRTFNEGRCSLCGDPRYLCLVIACATDDGVCSACGGKAAHQYREGSPYNMLCAPCQGTGKALSSLDVAAELVGSLPGPWTANPATFGGTDGVQALLYPTRAALDERGLRAVVARLAR